jgi:hypothetical protein
MSIELIDFRGFVLILGNNFFELVMVKIPIKKDKNDEMIKNHAKGIISG